MSNRVEDLEPWLQPWARWLLSLVPSAQLTSTRRTSQQQLQLYNAYLRGESKYPAAPPGRSMHEYGRAFDLFLQDPRMLDELGQIWESVGGTWGGRGSDPIHFEA